MPPQRSRRAADVLRFPGRALDPLADDQPDRIDLCDHPATPSPDQGQRHTEGESDDAVQARPGCSEKMAAPARLRAVNACSGRKGFPGWSVTGRRLIQNRWNTRFDNTSSRLAAWCRFQDYVMGVASDVTTTVRRKVPNSLDESDSAI